MQDDYVYAGFWARFGAMWIDTLLMMMIAWPILYFIYGPSAFDDSFGYPFLRILLEWILPIVATIAFWMTKSATPGKMALSLKVLDDETGDPLTLSQSLIRYFGYILSLIPLGAGFLWIIWDDKKRALHDKLAGTVVVKSVNTGVKPVEFNKPY